jgi:hypothetical protein
VIAGAKRAHRLAQHALQVPFGVPPQHAGVRGLERLEGALDFLSRALLERLRGCSVFGGHG